MYCLAATREMPRHIGVTESDDSDMLRIQSVFGKRFALTFKTPATSLNSCITRTLESALESEISIGLQKARTSGLSTPLRPLLPLLYRLDRLISEVLVVVHLPSRTWFYLVIAVGTDGQKDSIPPDH